MLADTLEPPDEIPELRPKPFCGVHVHFPDAIPIVVPCPLFGAVTDCGVLHALIADLVVGMAFIGVTNALRGTVCRQGLTYFLLVDRTQHL